MPKEARVSDSLDLELEVFVSYLVGVLEEQQILLIAKLSLEPLLILDKFIKLLTE